jgi:hypothetical protein
MSFSSASLEVETAEDALLLIRTAINKTNIYSIPMTSDQDAMCRTLVRSGAAFVFRVEGSGNETWADGLKWTPPQTKRDFPVGLSNFTEHSIISD